MPHNKQAIVIKNLLDNVREQHELTKFIVYSQDNSEGAKLLIGNTKKKGFFRSRFLNRDALKLRNSLFGGRKTNGG